MSQAQLLSDVIYHEDSLDVQQWLIYYISKPLVGSLEPIPVTIAELPGMLNSGSGTPASPATPNDAGFAGSSVRRKDIKTFDDLLNNFPMISRQMQSGLDKVFRDFNRDIGKPLPAPGSRPTTPIRSRSSSMSSTANGSIHSASSRRRAKRVSMGSGTTFADDEEEHMRVTLESAVGAAIDLFQLVDKQQLSFVASSTDLDGPAVEKLIERYVAEHVNDNTLFPRLCRIYQASDHTLEAQVHRMSYVDVAQVGIDIDGGRAGKRQLTARLNVAIEEFRKLGVASGPQQMLDILLETQKIISGNRGSSPGNSPKSPEIQSEKAPHMTMNADALVSLLLLVVIRSGVRHLQARLAYMRNFIFLDDVDNGELGYSLSTFEAVLQYLSIDSGGLREASKRNRKLWQATKNGNISEIKSILDPENGSISDEDDSVVDGINDGNGTAALRQGRINGVPPPDAPIEAGSEVYEDPSDTANLSHVFPFQANGKAVPPIRPKIIKRVSLDLRSLSGTSEISFHSRTSTLNSAGSNVDEMTTIEKLCQAEDESGNSAMMMAIEARKPEALDYLLSLDEHYTAEVVLEDCDADGTSLLSAAVQLAHMELVDIMVDFVFSLPDYATIKGYLAKPDKMGRTVAHYLFQAPHLIHRFGTLLPWRQRDRNGQTPLLALCRSYDHPKYVDMVNAALQTATDEQGDGLPLHVDSHIDGKGNTLLHAVKDPYLASRILQHCDADPNAANDKKFTPLMVASKFGRLDLVRALFRDSRVDADAREYRGLTAVDLAKDDELRRRIDDMMLVTHAPTGERRVTSVVRSFIVEDGSVRLLIKSAARSGGDMISVTGSQRAAADFEHLAKGLAVEQPASWLPSIFHFRSPCQIPSRPSKAVLADIQATLDRFLRIMLAHSAFAAHELLWEFILVPEIQPAMMAERSRLKAAILHERIREEYEPVDDVRDVESFVTHAREAVRPVHHATRTMLRRVGNLHTAQLGALTLLSTHTLLTSPDLHAAVSLTAKPLSLLPFLPATHATAFAIYTATLLPPPSDPHARLTTALHTLISSLLAILSALARPHALVADLHSARAALTRARTALRRATDAAAKTGPSASRPASALLAIAGAAGARLLEEQRAKALDAARKEAAATAEEERTKACELSYARQVIAAELAGWQELHGRLVRQAVREFARGCVVKERLRLDGMRRALRKVTEAREVGRAKREIFFG